MSEYEAVYEERFVRNLQRYAALRSQIKRRVDRVLADPYFGTELLSDEGGKLDLRGCRSAAVGSGFRLILLYAKNVVACQSAGIAFAKTCPTTRSSF